MSGGVWSLVSFRAPVLRVNRHTLSYSLSMFSDRFLIDKPESLFEKQIFDFQLPNSLFLYI